MAEIQDLEIVDASNVDRFPEGQVPSSLNDGGRALEGIVARWHKDTNASKASTGSANAYVFAADQTLSAYYDGLVIAFDANFENTGAATLNVDAVSADTIKKHNDQDLVAGDIEVGQKVWVVHDGTNWQMISPTARGGSPVTTRGDLVRGDSSGDSERLALGAAGQTPTSDGTDVVWDYPIPVGHGDGLVLSNNALDADHDIDIAAGSVRSDTDDYNMRLTSALGKQLDAPWTVGGTPAATVGGLDTGTIAADQTYHKWLIARPDTDVVDALFSLSATSPTMPTNYTKKQLIGSVRTDSSANIVPFFQWDHRFYLVAHTLDLNTTTPSTTEALVTTGVPTGLKLVWLGAAVFERGGTTTVEIRSPDEDDNAVSRKDLATRSSGNEAVSQFERITNTSGQIAYRSSIGSADLFQIYTIGWEHPRWRNVV